MRRRVGIRLDCDCNFQRACGGHLQRRRELQLCHDMFRPSLVYSLRAASGRAWFRLVRAMASARFDHQRTRSRSRTLGSLE
jgi:hypothetical protein